MALGAALVDRARTVSRETTGVVVDGERLRGVTEGQWFKARLDLPAAAEAQAPGGGRRRAVRQPTLLLGVADLDGLPVALSSAVRVEVDSPQLGRSVWEVAGDPMPLRKRRRVIGWQATLQQVGKGTD